MPAHDTLTLGDIHAPFSFEYADSAARNAATGLTAADVRKLAFQMDDSTVWMLLSVGPVTWKQMTSAGHGATHGGGGSDPSPLATTLVAGLMSAADKIKVDTFSQGNVTHHVRNETGVPIPKGRLVCIVGVNGVGIHLIDLADKDNPARRPACGVTPAVVPHNGETDILLQGVLENVDTSAFSITDQLVLGNGGLFVRPPPDNPTFTTGEVQNVGSIASVHATQGVVVVLLDGLTPINAPTILATQGTSGTPSDANRFVTDADPRNSNPRAPTAHAADHVTGGADIVPDATPVSSGLLSAADKSKLDGIAAGAGVPTREVFCAGTEYNANNGNYRTRDVGTGGAWRWTFQVPWDFTSLVDLALVGIVPAGAAAANRDIDLASSYGAVGETSTQQTGSDTTSLYDFTGLTGRFVEIPLATVFGALAAGDFCGLLVTHNAIGGTISYLGIRLRYL